jgi:LmbE family N-acetylglucosaminyl deacetylase
MNLYILAHPDDEVMCLHTMVERPIGNKVAVIYLTNGKPNGAQFSEAKRITEANIVADYLGYQDAVFFYGSELAIQDGDLASLFGIDAYLRLLTLVKDISPNNIFTTLLEGGHQDHDATYLIAKKISVDLGINLNAFPCYSPTSFKLPMYSTMKSVENSFKVSANLVSRVKMCFLAIKIMIVYSSQIKTWVGLSIPIVLKYAFGTLSIHQQGNRNLDDVQKFLYEIRGSFNREQIIHFESQIRSW